MGVKIYKNALSKIYREHDIHFLSTKYHFFLREGRNTKQEQQQQFVVKHLEWLKAGREVIYQDESSLNLWQKRLKIWRPVNVPLMCYMQKDRGKNFTMIGAISTHSDRPYVEIAPKTMKMYVITFLENYLRDHNGAVLVMDNHKAHKSKELKALCNAHNV